MTITTRQLCDKDLNRFERKILKNIQKYGWHANAIPSEDSSPGWAYSVGLFAKYGQPELIIFGLEVADMYQMISRYADLLQSGKTFHVAESLRDSKPSADATLNTDGILPNQPCVLRQVHVPWRETLLRSASWYYDYQEFPVLQCFWPDRHASKADGQRSNHCVPACKVIRGKR